MSNAPTHAIGRGDLQSRPVNHYEGSERSAAGLADDLASWRKSAPGRRPAGPGADFAREAVSALESVPGMVAAARAEIEHLNGDDTIAPQGRARLARERVSKLESDVQAAQDRARRMALAAQAEFTVQAYGEVPRADAMAARADLAMALRNVAPADVPARIAGLAKRGDHVGQLAAGAVGRLAMETSGADAATVARYQQAARASALEAAASSSDEVRAQAAAHAAHLDRLAGTLDWPASLGRIAAGELRRRAGLGS